MKTFQKLLFVLSLAIESVLSINYVYSQNAHLPQVGIFPVDVGPTACPNILATYGSSGATTHHFTFCGGGSVTVSSTIWSYQVTGGTLVYNGIDRGTSFETEDINGGTIGVKWTSSGGSITKTCKYRITCPFSTPFIQTLPSVSFSGPTLLTPTSVPAIGAVEVSAGSAMCSGKTITLRAQMPTGYQYQLDWQYLSTGMQVAQQVNIGSATTDASGWASLNFTVPDYINLNPPNRNLFFQIIARYAQCLNSSSNSKLTSTYDVYPSSPTLNIAKIDAICQGKASVTLSGTSSYPQVELILFDEDTVSAAPPVFTSVNTTTRQFSHTFTNITPRDASGRIKYRVQAGNYNPSDPTQITCFTPSDTISFATKNPTVNLPDPIITNETCYDPTQATGSMSFHPTVSSGMIPVYTYKLTYVPPTPPNAPSTVISFTNGMTPYSISNLHGDVDYTIEVTNSQGCKTNPVSIVRRIEEPNDIIFTLEYVKPVSCKSSAQGPTGDGEITVSATGGSGTANLEYFIDGSAPRAVGHFTGVSKGPHTLRVFDRGTGCSRMLPVNPVNVAEPDTEVSFQGLVTANALCFDSLGTFEVNGAGGSEVYTYSLDNGTFSNTNSYRVSRGDHTIRIRDSEGCVLPVTRTFTSPPVISFDVKNIFPQSCTAIQDGIIQVKATGGSSGFRYSLDAIPYTSLASPTPAGGTFEYKNLLSGNYIVTTKDANGCTKTTDFFVPTKQALVGSIKIANPISCYGDRDGILRADVTGGTAPMASYKWSNDNTLQGPVNAGLEEGTYSVEITDSKGCITTASRMLAQPARLTLSADVKKYSGFGVSCKDKTDGAIDLKVEGGRRNAQNVYIYEWSDQKTTEDNQLLAPGLYSVVVKDSSSCTASIEDIEITNPPELTLSLAKKKDISCKLGQDGEIELNVGGGAGGYRLSKNLSLWQSERLFDKLTANNYTIYLQDSNACAKQLDVSLIEPPVVTMKIVKQIETLCGEANGSAEVLAEGGVGNFSYKWFDDKDRLIVSTPSIAKLASGDYTVIGQDSNKCLISRIVSINDSNGPKITQRLLKELTCFQSDDGAIGIDVTQGAAPYTISWDIAGANTMDVTNVTGGEHWVEVRDKDGCRDKEFYVVPFPSALSMNYTTSPPLCKGNSDARIAVVASGGNAGGYTYVWNTGVTESLLQNIQAGTYSVTVRDSRLCSLTQEIKVEDPPLFTIDLGGNRTICVGQRVPLRAADEGTYLWTSSNSFTSNAREVILTEPAIYKLQVTSPNGCKAEDEFELKTSNDLLKADFLMAAEAYKSDTVVLIDISWPVPERISWSFPKEAIVISQEEAYAEISFPQSGDYTIVLNTNLGECIDKFIKHITVLGERPSAGGRQASSLIRTFEVYPNPSDGKFTVTVELNEKVQGRLMMVSLSGNAKLFDEPLDERQEISYEAILSNVQSGLYILILEAGKEKKYKRLIIR